MVETTEHSQPRLDRKGIALVLIILLIVAAGLAKLAFETTDTDRSGGLFLVVVGVLYALLNADRELASWLNRWAWRHFGNSWPWTIIGLDGMRMLNIGLGILLIITGIATYVRPLL